MSGKPHAANAAKARRSSRHSYSLSDPSPFGSRKLLTSRAEQGTQVTDPVAREPTIRSSEYSLLSSTSALGKKVDRSTKKSPIPQKTPQTTAQRLEAEHVQQELTAYLDYIHNLADMIERQGYNHNRFPHPASWDNPNTVAIEDKRATETNILSVKPQRARSGDFSFSEIEQNLESREVVVHRKSPTRPMTSVRKLQPSRTFWCGCLPRNRVTTDADGRLRCVELGSWKWRNVLVQCNSNSWDFVDSRCYSIVHSALRDRLYSTQHSCTIASNEFDRMSDDL